MFASSRARVCPALELEGHRWHTRCLPPYLCIDTSRIVCHAVRCKHAEAAQHLCQHFCILINHFPALAGATRKKMLAYKCKSLYVLWNRIIIVLIYQPCAVPGDGWEVLAKKGLYFQQKNGFAELHKRGWNNQRCFCLWNLFPVRLSVRASPHCRLKCNYFTSGHVQNKSVQGRYWISYLVSTQVQFFPPVWGCGSLWSHWLQALPGRTEAFWDTEQNMWIVPISKALPQIRNSPNWINYSLLTFLALRPK